jgi:hypothetical protein
MQHACSPWNQGATWSEFGSIPARREISLDRNHSMTASLLGGLAVWNSEWAVGLRLLLLAGLQTEHPGSVWANINCHSKNIKNRNGYLTNKYNCLGHRKIITQCQATNCLATMDVSWCINNSDVLYHWTNCGTWPTLRDVCRVLKNYL